MPVNRWNLPDLGLGVGLRTVHFDYVLEHTPPVDFFEIVSENFTDTGGRPLYVLDRVAERYPIVMHGVSMNIGSCDSIDPEYLAKLKRLAARCRAAWISDHLCWNGVAGRNTHDLLPMPLTEEALHHVARRVRQVQEFLERPLIIENPSSYLQFSVDVMPEWEFLTRLCEEADCGLLLDVNNVYVSSFNHHFDPRTYVDAIPPERIVYHHLAGHTHKGTHIIDTHNDHVIDEVWDLYARCHARTGGRATMVEWDADIPPFETVYAEVKKAERFKLQEAPARV